MVLICFSSNLIILGHQSFYDGIQEKFNKPQEWIFMFYFRLIWF